MEFCGKSEHGAFVSFYSNAQSNNVPSSTTVTYGGLFDENYFPLNAKETKAFYNLEISNASVISPLTNKREYYLGVLLKSKYDGLGLREPIDIGLSIDVSGSMSGESIEFTKKSVFKFLQNLNENDNICINKFNEKDKLILPFQKKNEFNNLDDIINSLEASGGTNIYNGIFGIYNEIKKYYDKGNKNKKIVLIKDLEYKHDEQFIQLCKQMSKEKIYLTILGISDRFNTKLVEEIAHIAGCNYYVITNSNDIEKYLVNEFNFICFPLSFNNILEINAPNLSISSVIATGKKNLKENETILEWNQSSHKLYNQNFRDGIFYMLRYFKKKGLILPKPVIFCISKYIQTSHIKTFCEIDTVFPSSLKEIDNKIYVKGGIFLIRLNEDTLHKNNFVQFNMKYKNAIDDKNYEISSLYGFDKVDKNDYFSDEKIEKALGLYFLGKFSRILMKYFNNEFKNKNNIYIQDIIEGNKTEEIKDLVQKFFEQNFKDNINNENYIKYIKNLSNITNNTKEYIEENISKKKETKNEK